VRPGTLGSVDLNQSHVRAPESCLEELPVSIKPIRLFGDPVLRTPADPVLDFDAELRKLVADLTDTMQDAPGLGLAAPQIGVGLRVFTYYVDDMLGHLINPDLDLSADEDTDDEGCLSFPGLAYPTKRAYGVVAKGFNMHGEPITVEGSGMLARCVQHETDHLDGVLFIDRMDAEQRKLAMKEIRASEWWGEDVPVLKVSPHQTYGKAL
jgi:peptide deformylase